MPALLRRTFHAAARRLRPLASEQSGFTIVEVLVSAVMVSLIAGGVMTGLEASGRATSDIRDRSRADEIAQQDQERMRGMSALELQNLDQTRYVTFDGSAVPSCASATGACYTVQSTGQFLGSGSGKSCGTDQAAYVKVVSTVTWGQTPGLGGNRPPVVEQSIITPPIGGVILVKVPDEFGASGGTAGATVNVNGPDNLTTTTDSGGCAVFGGAALGDYNVTAAKSGYVDPDGNPTVTGTVTATASDTSTVNLKALGQAGSMSAQFQTTIAGTTCASTCSGQLAPSLSWFNPGMAAARSVTPGTPASTITTPVPANLFPFTTGSPPGYTNNYSVYAGRCSSDAPTSGGSFATVTPGGTAVPKINLPGMVINVSYRTVVNTIRVTPTLIKLTDSCGQVWSPPVRSAPADPNSPLGQLQYPGQPWGSYGICVQFNGYRAQTLFLNQNFGVANTANLTIDSRPPATKQSCP
jgi:Tfp pilus assembly protein PilV